ncbi:SMI1/KNR4 family protein [Planomonospora sp. ID82291]|uniref:SMI1/KNR4 family protein n=1 Tax=Planomonospora sp. ID82291 TaxID=2738136 RepID=UPI0018C3F9D0|nr:SMI1/KNR4 family protein [Planomonospora sp. ID82291]MBG0817873.1 hypothetical protein [Planomonospora sp. ID82291]
MAAIADLEQLIGGPSKQPPPVDWPSIEAELGLTFPSDFKEWASRYTETRIDQFLYIHHPGIRPEKSLKEDAEARLKQLRPIIEEWGSIDLIDETGEEREVEPFPLYPETGGVYPWGSTDNGDYLLWLTNPNPRNWSIVVTNGASWWHYNGSFIEFIVGILSREIACPILPDDFPEILNREEYAQADIDRIANKHIKQD